MIKKFPEGASVTLKDVPYDIMKDKFEDDVNRINAWLETHHSTDDLLGI